MRCDVLDTTHTLGKKWAIPIMQEIKLKKFKGFYQFTLKAKITPRTLSKQLKELEESGLLKKSKGEESYALTKKGNELCTVLDEIKKWNIKWNNVAHSCLDRSCAECKYFSREQGESPAAKH